MSKLSAVLESKPLLLLLFGPPGIGKGTFGRKLALDFRIKHLVIGDLLRREANQQSLLGSELRGLLSRGSYVKDDIVCDIIRKEVASHPSGVILDGAPRTGQQALFVKRLAQSLQMGILGASLELDSGILIERLRGRRVGFFLPFKFQPQVCQKCNRTYNVCNINRGEYIMPALLPSEEDLQKCDGCRDLKMRDDDSIDVLQHRLEVYNEANKSVFSCCKDVPIMDFKIKRGIDDYDLFKAQFEEFLMSNTP